MPKNYDTLLAEIQQKEESLYNDIAQKCREALENNLIEQEGRIESATDKLGETVSGFKGSVSSLSDTLKKCEEVADAVKKASELSDKVSETASTMQASFEKAKEELLAVSQETISRIEQVGKSHDELVASLNQAANDQADELRNSYKTNAESVTEATTDLSSMLHSYKTQLCEDVDSLNNLNSTLRTSFNSASSACGDILSVKEQNYAQMQELLAELESLKAVIGEASNIGSELNKQAEQSLEKYKASNEAINSELNKSEKQLADSVEVKLRDLQSFVSSIESQLSEIVTKYSSILSNASENFQSACVELKHNDETISATLQDVKTAVADIKTVQARIERSNKLHLYISVGFGAIILLLQIIQMIPQ